MTSMNTSNEKAAETSIHLGTDLSTKSVPGESRFLYWRRHSILFIERGSHYEETIFRDDHFRLCGITYAALCAKQARHDENRTAYRHQRRDERKRRRVYCPSTTHRSSGDYSGGEDESGDGLDFLRGFHENRRQDNGYG